MFFDCFEDAVCYLCGKSGVLQKTEKDGRETAFNEDAPIQPVNVQAWLICETEFKPIVYSLWSYDVRVFALKMDIRS